MLPHEQACMQADQLSLTASLVCLSTVPAQQQGISRQ